MNFADFIQWAFLGLVSGGVVILYNLQQSVQTLNERIAVIISRTDTHEKRLDKLEEKLSYDKS